MITVRNCNLHIRFSLIKNDIGHSKKNSGGGAVRYCGLWPEPLRAEKNILNIFEMPGIWMFTEACMLIQRIAAQIDVYVAYACIIKDDCCL